MVEVSRDKITRPFFMSLSDDIVVNKSKVGEERREEENGIGPFIMG